MKILKVSFGILVILFGVLVEIAGLAGTFQWWGIPHGGQLNILNGILIMAMGWYIICN